MAHTVKQSELICRRNSLRALMPIVCATSAVFLFRTMQMETKRCTKCKKIKVLSEFNIEPRKPAGYRSECKKCEYKRQYKNRGGWRATPLYKWSCYSKLHYAVRCGVVIKPKHCEDCGKKAKTQGHHEDYSQPLEVIWLCSKCHNRLQRSLKIA